MTDNYLPSSAKPSAAATATHSVPGSVVGDIILEPLKWSVEFQKLAMEYIGEPEQVHFMKAARCFAALARVLPPPEEKPDGFVVLGDID